MKYTTTPVPTSDVGPVRINFSYEKEKIEEVLCPIATFETTLFSSINRGARVSRKLEQGIETEVGKDCMTRSILLRAKNVGEAGKIGEAIKKDLPFLQEETKKTSRYAQLHDLTIQQVATNLYIRFEMSTGEASGHNMVTKAADHLANICIQKYPLEYLSVSGNTCIDKKTSAINPILGRGKEVNAVGVISREICDTILHITPEKMRELNTSKNHIGSILAGSICTANAHFANMVAGIYIATGQDIANIVEGSQGITTCDITQKGDLEFGVYCPNIIVGTVGNGKTIPEIQERLKKMGCVGEGSAKRLSQIVAGIVWCGELSLMASLTDKGSLIKAHTRLERGKKTE